MVRDPVCGMEIEEHEAAAISNFKGATYYFCAPSCKRAFEKETEKYIHKLLNNKESHKSNNKHKEN